MALVSTVRVCVYSVLALPLLDHGVNGVNEPVLWNGVEETDQIVVGRVQGNVGRCVGKVGLEVAPQLGDGKLAGVLGVEVLQNSVEGSAGNA